MAAACRSRAPGPSASRGATPGSRWKSVTGIRRGYVAKVRQAAAALERERYLLAEDVTRIVDEAMSPR